jgi:hypothetical protein
MISETTQRFTEPESAAMPMGYADPNEEPVLAEAEEEEWEELWAADRGNQGA